MSTQILNMSFRKYKRYVEEGDVVAIHMVRTALEGYSSRTAMLTITVVDL